MALFPPLLPRHRRSLRTLVGTALATFLLGGAMAMAADWPQFFGPDRNGVSTETLASHFGKEGAPTAWKAKVGNGFSGPVVAGGRVFLAHRQGDEEVVQAFDAGSGKSLWRSAVPATYVDDFGFDNGPRATPVIRNNRLIALGADGHLRCLKTEDGAELWNRSLRKELGADKGFFGLACSPVIEGRWVLLNVGGRDGAGIVAFDVETGKLGWKATDHDASYSSPVVATVDGQKYALFFTRDGLSGLDPETGRVRFEFPWRASMNASVNAAIPVVSGDSVLLTASYDTGAVLLRMRPDAVEKRWASDEALSSQFASPVLHGAHLYGFHGRVDGPKPDFRCVEWATGKVLWSESGLGPGSVLCVGEDLIVLLESGEVLVVPAQPKEFKPRARFQALGNGARAVPAFAGGRLYARDKAQLLCVDMGRP